MPPAFGIFLVSSGCSQRIRSGPQSCALKRPCRASAFIRARSASGSLYASRQKASAVVTAGASLFVRPMPHYFGGGETVTSIAE
jgi:hypothetical protein